MQRNLSSQKLFDELPHRNVGTWNSLISGYLHVRLPEIAVSLFIKMLKPGIVPTVFSVSALLVACSQLDDEAIGAQVHGLSLKQGFRYNVVIETGLIDMYSKCCNVEDSKRVFDQMEEKNVITWASMVTGYAQNEQPDDAMILFKEMLRFRLKSNYVAYNSLRSSFSGLEYLGCCKQVHCRAVHEGLLDNVYMVVTLRNRLVFMYAICGAINDARKVFLSMDERDLVSWNSLLSRSAHHGYDREAVQLFEQVRRTEIKPDGTTFLVVLSACCHAGFIDKGLQYFYLMRNDASLEPPSVEHYGAVVGLLGRAGFLNEAESFINSMSIDPGPSVYQAFFSACQVHGNREIAASSAKRVLDLWPNDPAIYVLLSNVSKAAGCWDDAGDIRTPMYNRGIRKKPGYSWV